MKNQKKIFFVINDLLVGGAEKAFINQANTLIKRGYDIYFVILQGAKVDQSFVSLLDSKIKILKLNLISIFDIKQLRYFLKLVSEHKPQVIYSTLDHANIVSRVAKIFNPKLHVVVRESGMADRKSVKSKLADIVLNFLTDFIIAVSPAVAESLSRYQPFHTKKIKTLENGVVLPSLPNKEKDFSEIKLFHVGSMDNDNKNQIFIIKAVEMINKKYPSMKISLSLVGEGRIRQTLEEYVVKNNLTKLVHFHNKCSPQELSVKYFDSDIFTFASKSEGSPNAVLEAMAHGLPVITLSIDSLKPVINDGQNGFFVDFGNLNEFAEKIVFLASNVNLIKQMGDNARQMVESSYSIDKRVNELEEILFI